MQTTMTKGTLPRTKIAIDLVRAIPGVKISKAGRGSIKVPIDAWGVVQQQLDTIGDFSTPIGSVRTLLATFSDGGVAARSPEAILGVKPGIGSWLPE